MWCWCCCCVAIQFSIRSLVLQLRTMGWSHFRDCVCFAISFDDILDVYISWICSSRTYTSAPAFAIKSSSGGGSIYLSSMILCLKNFLLCNAYDDFNFFLSSSGKLNGASMDIGQKCCFVHAYVRVRLKPVCMCVRNCRGCWDGHREWWCVVRYKVCVFGIISILERNEMKWNRRQNRKHWNIQCNGGAHIKQSY